MQLILFHLFYITRNCFLFSLKYQREPPSDDEVPFSSIIFSNNQITKSTQKPFIQKGPRCPPQSFLGQKNRHTRGRTSSRNKRGPTTGWLSRYRGRTKKKKKKRGYINKQRVYRFVHAKGEGMTLRRIGESDRWIGWPTVWSERRGRNKTEATNNGRNEWSVLTRTRVTFLDFLRARADAHAAARRSGGIQSGRCVDVSRRTG